MGILDNLYKYSMVHPSVASAYLTGKNVPERILINEVPETSFVAAGIAAGIYDGGGEVIPPSLLSDGYEISMMTWNANNPYMQEISAMPIYSDENMYSYWITDSLDSLENITSMIIGNHTYNVIMVDPESEEPDLVPGNIYLTESGESMTGDPLITEESITMLDGELSEMEMDVEEMEQEIEDAKAEGAPEETIKEMEKDLEYYKSLLYTYQAMADIMRDNIGKYMLMTYGYIIFEEGVELSGNYQMTINTEYEGGETGIINTTLYEFVEPYYEPYIRIESCTWWNSSYSIRITRNYCSAQYSTYNDQGQMIQDWTDTDGYAYITNIDEAVLKARGVNGDGEVVVEPQSVEIPWPYINYNINTNTPNPGNVSITWIGSHNNYPTSSSIYYSTDGENYTQVEVVRETTNTILPDMWGDQNIYIKGEYEGDGNIGTLGKTYSHIYQQSVSVVAPEPVYKGLVPRVDGTGADIVLGTWSGDTEYKLDNQEWVVYDSENLPSITDTDAHTLQMRTSADGHISDPVSVNIPAMTQYAEPLYMTFTAGEEGAEFDVGIYSNAEYVLYKLQISSDLVTWENVDIPLWGRSTPISISANDSLYIRGFIGYNGGFPKFEVTSGSIAVTGCLDALISPVFRFVPGYEPTFRDIFQGDFNCSDITLCNIDYSRAGYSDYIYRYMFRSNTGTKTFSNFNTVQSSKNCYGDMFYESCIESVSNIPAGYDFSSTFSNSNLNTMPLLPYQSDNNEAHWWFQRAFNNCSINVVDSEGNYNFGENNFTYPIFGCQNPKALVEYFGIVDPDVRIYLNVNSYDMSVDVNGSGMSNDSNTFDADQIGEDGLSISCSMYDGYTFGACYMSTDPQSNKQYTLKSTNPEFYLKPDSTHGYYYLSIEPQTTVESLSIVDGNGDPSEHATAKVYYSINIIPEYHEIDSFPANIAGFSTIKVVPTVDEGYSINVQYSRNSEYWQNVEESSSEPGSYIIEHLYQYIIKITVHEN